MQPVDAEFYEVGTRCTSNEQLNVLASIIELMKIEDLPRYFIHKVVDFAVFDANAFSLVEAWFIAGANPLGEARKVAIYDELWDLIDAADDTKPYDMTAFQPRYEVL